MNLETESVTSLLEATDTPASINTTIEIPRGVPYGAMTEQQRNLVDQQLELGNGTRTITYIDPQLTIEDLEALVKPAASMPEPSAPAAPGPDDRDDGDAHQEHETRDAYWSKSNEEFAADVAAARRAQGLPVADLELPAPVATVATKPARVPALVAALDAAIASSTVRLIDAIAGDVDEDFDSYLEAADVLFAEADTLTSLASSVKLLAMGSQYLRKAISIQFAE